MLKCSIVLFIGVHICIFVYFVCVFITYDDGFYVIVVVVFFLSSNVMQCIFTTFFLHIHEIWVIEYENGISRYCAFEYESNACVKRQTLSIVCGKIEDFCKLNNYAKFPWRFSIFSHTQWIHMSMYDSECHFHSQQFIKYIVSVFYKSAIL